MTDDDIQRAVNAQIRDAVGFDDDDVKRIREKAKELKKATKIEQR